MRNNRFIFAILFMCVLLKSAWADIGPALPVYTDDQLFKLFAINGQLKKVKADDCQLVQDIEARAKIVESPAYQFLYGDMLAWGVCVDKNTELGLYYIQLSAKQGLPYALEQLGRYYSRGVLVQKDKEYAVVFLREAASLGNISAKIQLAQLLIAGFGSPLDYEDAYRWLYLSVTDDKRIHRQITSLRHQLANKMPSYVVARAKQRASFW